MFIHIVYGGNSPIEMEEILKQAKGKIEALVGPYFISRELDPIISTRCISVPPKTRLISMQIIFKAPMKTEMDDKLLQQWLSSMDMDELIPFLIADADEEGIKEQEELRFKDLESELLGWLQEMICQDMEADESAFIKLRIGNIAREETSRLMSMNVTEKTVHIK